MDKDTALDLALNALRSAAAELYRASSYCNTYEVLGNTNDAITAIQQARAAQPAQQEPVGTYGEIFESMRSLLQSGRQADQQIYMAMQHKPLYTSPPAQPAPSQKPIGRFTGRFWTDDAHNRMMCEVVCDVIPTAGAALYTTPPNVATPLAAQPAPVQEPEKRECMNCAAFGGCHLNNDAGRCGYEPPAAPVQEPCQYAVDVAMPEHRCVGKCQYAAQRPWVGLTDDEINNCCDFPLNSLGMKHVRKIEAKLKEKNT